MLLYFFYNAIALTCINMFYVYVHVAEKKYGS